MKNVQMLSMFLVLSFFARAQQVLLPFEQVKRYTKLQTPSRYDSSLKYLTNRLGVEFHYLYPLYQAIGWEEKFKRSLGEKTFNARFAQLLAFAGDYSTAMYYATKSYDTLDAQVRAAVSDTVQRLKNIQYIPAKEAILNIASQERVIMINESAAKPVHRAFTYSLLEDLYNLGYRYLAMEALNNFSNNSLDSLTVFTGYNTGEPVAGEMVRKALRLGFTLVAYDDTLALNHSQAQRDSVQANNLNSVLKNDTSVRMIVYGSYGHLGESRINGVPQMAGFFKKLSGINPYTIDQTGLTEGSEFAYGGLYYQYFNARFNITEPSVIFQNKRPFDPLDETGYDMRIIHPPAQFQHNRPAWLTLGGERKLLLVQPTEKLLFFVQAFYSSEYDPATVNSRVPADQTYITNREGYYPLYLRPGRYTIVLRDISYKILSTKETEVE